MEARVNSDCSSMINIRKEAKMDAEIVNRIPVDTIVNVLQRGKKWSIIECDGESGFISNRFLVFGEEQ